MIVNDDQWVRVVAGVIVDANDNILIARRPDTAHQGGKWEFPGGKIESGENRLDALTRELHEEIGIEVVSARPLITVRHHYTDKNVELDVWKVTAFTGEAHGREDQSVEWVTKKNLPAYEFPAANIPIMRALNLPDLCLISGEAHDAASFADSLQQAALLPAVMFVYRQHNLSDAEWHARLNVARAAASHARQRFQVNCSVQQIPDLDAQDGVHLSSYEAKQLAVRPCDKQRLFGVSCHTLAEIEHAHQLDADYLLLSPVKVTATHPDQSPMGWAVFNELSAVSRVPVYALGGLTPHDLPRAWAAGAQGIAGIRWWNK